MSQAERSINPHCQESCGILAPSQTQRTGRGCVGLRTGSPKKRIQSGQVAGGPQWNSFRRLGYPEETSGGLIMTLTDRPLTHIFGKGMDANLRIG